MSNRYKENMDNMSMEENEASTSKISNVHENTSGNTIDHIPKKLLNCWVFWKISTDSTLRWGERLTPKAYFWNVREFERKYDDLFPATTELETDFDYAIFRQGIRPIWEDECNRDSGKWIFTMEKGRGNEMLRFFWKKTCLFMIGENFSASERIHGSVVNIRKETGIISLWTANADDEFTVSRIGSELKTLLDCRSVRNNIIYRTYANSVSQEPESWLHYLGLYTNHSCL